MPFGRIASALSALALVSYASAAPAFHVRSHIPRGPMNEVYRGQLMVKLKPNYEQAVRTGKVSLRSLPVGSRYLHSVGHGGWTIWQVPAKLDPAQLSDSVRRDPAVAAAEPVNRIYLLSDPNDLDYGQEESDPGLIMNFTDTPITFTRLWHLNDTNAVAGWATYPGLWYTAITKPLDCPKIAVIDTGCDMNHPDFVNAGGGGSDILQGGQLNKALSAKFALGEVDPAGSLEDTNGHGTHVTGLALAAANNLGFDSHGVIGIGFNAQGVILRVFDDSGNGSDADAAAAIFYAADNGVDVISLSLGTTNYSQLFQDAVTYAWQKGCLIVCAGNENGSGGGNLGPIYPAACSGALAVSANGPNGVPATGTYSGYGYYVDIAAPGGDVVQSVDYTIIQFVWSTAMRTQGSLYTLSQSGALYPPYNLNYAYLAGTSMACPQVSGAAALFYGKNNLRAAQGYANVRAYRALEASAVSVMGAPNGGWEYYQGYGSLDIDALLTGVNTRTSTVGALEGIVYSNLTPTANVQVKARKGTGVTYSTTTQADGTFRFDGLAPGTYDVWAAPFGQLKHKLAVVKAGSDETGFDFRCGSYTEDLTPPDVRRFNVTSFNSTAVQVDQWANDPESGIDAISFRIGTTVGGSDTKAATLIPEDGATWSLGGFTLQPGITYYLRVVYTNGAGLTTTVDRTLAPSSPTATGTIVLQDYTGAMVPVTIQVRNPGSTTPISTYTLTPGAGGTFSIPSPPPGTYDFAVKASHWLRQRVQNVVVTGAGVSGLSFSLANGDVDGDNSVGTADFNALRAAFGSSSGSPNWNASADLNGDGSVGTADFNILRTHFGQSGSP